MAVADDAVKPSPPLPTRIVVAVLALVRFVLAAMQAFGLVAARAFPDLCLVIAWVHSAAWAAEVVTRRACREGSAPLVFFEAFTDAASKFIICIIFLFPAAYVIAIVSGSGSEFKKSTFGEITQEKGLIKLPRALVFGFFAALAFILLIVAGTLAMMMSSPVEGSISQGEMIGSLIADVGTFGIHATFCFVIIPTLAVSTGWQIVEA